MWKNADAKGQVLVAAAQNRLSALHDRPATVPLGRPR
jgi:hypothetical protein